MPDRFCTTFDGRVSKVFAHADKSVGLVCEILRAGMKHRDHVVVRHVEDRFVVGDQVTFQGESWVHMRERPDGLKYPEQVLSSPTLMKLNGITQPSTSHETRKA